MKKEVKRILSRPRPSKKDGDSDSSPNSAQPVAKTFEEREDDYAKARERIFGRMEPQPVCPAGVSFVARSEGVAVSSGRPPPQPLRGAGQTRDPEEK